MQEGTYSSLHRLTAVGLAAAAVGIGILKLGGVAMPVVPPGLVLLLVGAVVVVTSSRRWAAVLALLVGLAELVGTFASGSATELFDPATALVGVGTWIRILGVVMAIMASWPLAFRRRTPQMV